MIERKVQNKPTYMKVAKKQLKKPPVVLFILALLQKMRTKKNYLLEAVRPVVHSFFYKNIFYKNIEAQICEILRIF